MKTRALIFFLVMLFGGFGLIYVLSHKAHSAPAPDDCKAQFYNGQMPDITASDKPWIAPDQIYTICFTSYGLQGSTVSKAPVFSGEHLTAARINAAKSIKRKDEFHPESKIVNFTDRALLADFLGTHYDRGHMSPDKDMPDAISMYESFSLANMVAQNSCNNEIIWKAIETAVRKYALADNDIYVVTGPIFEYVNNTNTRGTIGTGKVWVPKRLFKAVYDPAKNAEIIVVTDNENVTTYDTFTPDQLLAATGVNPFPGVTNTVVLDLPALPHLTGNCKKEEPK